MASPYVPTPLPPVGNAWSMAMGMGHNHGGELRSVTPATNNTRHLLTPQQQHPQLVIPLQQQHLAAHHHGVLAPNPNINNTLINNNNNQQRFSSAPRMGGHSDPIAIYAPNRSVTPSRVSVYTRQDDPVTITNNLSNAISASSPMSSSVGGPSSTGLIRLSLKKPMGIVFEPMYDPNQPSAQRGVRICDLPRTGAAALSRKLQVGDELLQINDKTVSRLTFDEIMDFIIDADPDAVNLLFRRPRKETLQARQGVPQKLQAAANKDNPSKIKWQIDSNGPDDNDNTTNNDASTTNNSETNDVDNKNNSKKKGSKKTKKEKPTSSSNYGKSGKQQSNKRGSVSEEEETLQSSLGEQESYAQQKQQQARLRRRKGQRGKKDPFETESFLDLLIDTICTNSGGICRDMGAPKYHSDDDYEDQSFEDESTYVTYEESVDEKKVASASKSANDRKKRGKDTPGYEAEEVVETEEEEGEEEGSELKSEEPRGNKRKEVKPNVNGISNPKNNVKAAGGKQPHPYHPDPLPTLEHEPSKSKEPVRSPISRQPASPTGLQPISPPQQQQQVTKPAVILNPIVPDVPEEEQTNPGAPIREVEYDDRIDHGADVSVMESLGGPSLLIEKQRALQQTNRLAPPVPAEIMDNFGLDYLPDFGKTRQETIQADPLRYYTFVVKSLLEQYEPEKVRLLDKLLAKYKGREDHLVQKLSVRYNNRNDNNIMNVNNNIEVTATSGVQMQEQEGAFSFSDAVKKSKASPLAAQTVHAAQQRLLVKEEEPVPFATSWPEKDADVEDRQQSPQQQPSKQHPDDDHREEASEEDEDDYSHEDSVDGTSPAVIAQVSELLNYVYGKTSVPGQIDRVSTIMRAYEGREAVLLELLETKALIKANKEKESAADLPSFLRHPPAARSTPDKEDHGDDGEKEEEGQEMTDNIPPTPMSAAQVQSHVSHDDISSMSGISSPAHHEYHRNQMETMYMPTHSENDEENFFATPRSMRSNKEHSPMSASFADTSSGNKWPSGQMKSSSSPPAASSSTKKKKGLFGGLFKKKDRGSRHSGKI